MAEIFISYKREDKRHAQAVADLVASRGYSVWWDVDLLSGDMFSKEIERILLQAKAAVVLWSSKSVDSHWVKEEAELARSRGIIVPAVIDKTEIPFGFRNINTASLVEWDLSAESQLAQTLIQAIDKKTGRVSTILEDKSVRDQLKATHAREVIAWKKLINTKSVSAGDYTRFLEEFGSDSTFAPIAVERSRNLATVAKDDRAGSGLVESGQIASQDAERAHQTLSKQITDLESEIDHLLKEQSLLEPPAWRNRRKRITNWRTNRELKEYNLEASRLDVELARTRSKLEKLMSGSMTDE